jgi:hypothetical protein
MYHASSMRAPLIIAQGANDPRVKRAESDQIYNALKGKGLEVQYFLYEGEQALFTPAGLCSAPFQAVCSAYTASQQRCGCQQQYYCDLCCTRRRGPWLCAAPNTDWPSARY